MYKNRKVEAKKTQEEIQNRWQGTQVHILEKHFTPKYFKHTFIVLSGSKKIIQQEEKRNTK